MDKLTREAAAWLWRCVDAEMQRPAAKRNYKKIARMTEEYCALIGVDTSAAAARGMAALLREPAPAQEVTFTVTEGKAPWLRYCTAAAACAVVGIGMVSAIGYLGRMGDPVAPPEPTEIMASDRETAPTTEETQVTLPALPPVTETFLVEVTEPVQSITLPESLPPTDPPEPTSPPPTEPPAPETAPPTDPPQTDPPTEPPTDPPTEPLTEAQGYFEIRPDPLQPEQDLVEYLRECTQEPARHRIEAEGFTCEALEGDGENQYFLLEGGEQRYVLSCTAYGALYCAFDRAEGYVYEPLTVQGRPALLIWQPDLPEDRICTLLWDDGCHLAAITSQRKDLAVMEWLAGQLVSENLFS